MPTPNAPIITAPAAGATVRGPFVLSMREWSPADLSGTLLWLDAQTHAQDVGMTTADSASIPSAIDYASQGNLTQPTTSKQPILRYDGTRWGYEFDGVDDYLQRVVALPNAPFTVIFAWHSLQASQSANAAPFASTDNSQLLDSLQYSYTTNTPACWQLVSRSEANTNVLTPGPSSALAPNIVCLSGPANGMHRLRVNETLYASPATDVGGSAYTVTGGSFELFRFGANRGVAGEGPNAWCQMTLAGAIILDHQATDSERLQISRWMNTRYAMGLAL